MNDSLAIPFRALLPMAGEAVENGTLIIERGVIGEIIPGPPPAGLPVLDFKDALILPGFVNAHSHLALSALAGRLRRRERFTDWVRDLLRENTRVTPEERSRALAEGALALLRSGVSAFGDYLDHAERVDEYAALPQRQVLFLETLGFPASAARPALDRVLNALAARPSPGPRIRFGLAPHAPYSVSRELLTSLSRLAAERGLRLSCHVAEFAEEVRFLREGGGEMAAFLKERGVYDEGFIPPGQSPLAYLAETGALAGLMAVHLNHIEGDLDLLAKHGASAVFCPGSTRWFGREAWMPVRELLDRGVPVGLGTDSLASNESLNFFRELRMAETMLPTVSRRELLEMATRMGAEALGLNSGVLAPGRPADLIALKLEGQPENWQDVPFEPARNKVDGHVIAGEVMEV